MSLERVLQICFAALATLATVLLGMGEQNPVLPLVAASVAFSSVYFCDIQGWIRLNTPLANLFGLAALVLSVWDYRSFSQENQLLALANLLIYLQCVLLYRPKTPRIYWMLALLGLLQVAVATVLNLTFWFGMLLVVYMLLAIATLMLFLIYREQRHYAGQRDEEHESPIPQPALVRHSFTFVPRTMSNATGREIRAGLLRQVARMAAATVVLTAIVFVVVPRSEGTTWGEQAVETQHVVGFSDSIELGELGEIVQDPEEVLQVRFFDHESDTPYYLSEVPLLRGTVLTRYHDGKWTAAAPTAEPYIPLARPGQQGLVRQEYKINRLDTKTLFAIYPIYQQRREKRFVYYADIDRLARGQATYSFPLEYSLLTNGLYGGKQLPVTPSFFKPNTLELNVLLQPVDLRRHAGLKQMANEIVRDLPDDAALRAQALERFLKERGGFRYTLTPPKRDPDLDPIEDFLLHNRAGHCEYFATALTLMLRSVGIPSRMVVGFKGADLNPLTGYYHVQQLHAHTWVEVYLTPEQLPKQSYQYTQALIPQEQWANGGWLRLDPTTALEAGEMPPPDRFPTLKHMLDYADGLWSGYVLSMNARRQRETIFDPIRRGTQGIMAVLLDGPMWAKTFENFGKLLRGERLDDEGLWFSWRAAVITFVGLTLLLLLYRGVARIVRRVFKLTRPGQAVVGSPKDAEVEFYRRLESLLLEHQLVRLPSQTQREFALSVGDELANEPRTLHVAGVPRRVAEMFYRVRFGREHLTSEHLAGVDHSLNELAAALAAPPP